MNDAVRLSFCLPEEPREHTVLRVPESHTLYIGPPACTRRHLLTAEQKGIRRLCSALFLTETDVISGDYETRIREAVSELLELLEPRPRILLLVFFCVDDFLGTDEEALLRSLEKNFPGVVFAADRIDPVAVRSPSENTVMSRQLLGLYRFLRRSEVRDRGVSFVGNFVSQEPECELFRCLSGWGLSPVREIFRCEDYESYQSLARSRLCLAFRCPGEDTLTFFRETLGIPTVFLPPEYSAERVRQEYELLSSAAGLPLPDWVPALCRETEEEARKTARSFQTAGITVAVDSKAFLRPFLAAKALLDYGFPVRYVFHGQRIWEEERPVAEELRRRGLLLLRKDDYPGPAEDGGEKNCLAVGGDCHRLLRSRYYADVWHDEGFWGFHGIRRLMELLRREADCPWTD